MRIGIIGIGDICKKAYLPILTTRADIEIVLCTRNQSIIDEVKARYRIKEGYTSIDELIASGIDAAMVNSSTDSHFGFAKKLLENKIPTYIDKPVSYSYRDIEELYKLSKLNKTKIMVGFNRRHIPKVKELKELGTADIIIMQKNRLTLPDASRVFVVDDYIHVVDTIRFLMGAPHTDMSIKYKKDKRGLLNVVLTLSNENTTAIGIMNRDNGITEEVIEYMASGRKTVVTSLVKATKLVDNKISIEEFGDWIPTLYKRGFENLIDEFISFISEDRASNPTIEDSIITHKICEDIVNFIEMR